MDAINKKLIELYKKYSSEMEDNKEYYPYLMQCPKEYEKANIKIMFVGNDIRNFIKKGGSAKFSLEEVMKKYETNQQNLANQFASLLNEKINSENSKNYLVTELFMLGEYTGSRCDFNAVDKWLDANYSILREEVEICKPDCVVFLTREPSMEDTFLLKGLLGSDIVFMPIRECSDITLIQTPKKVSEENVLLIRVPRPKKSRTQTISKKEAKIVDISSKIINKIK